MPRYGHVEIVGLGKLLYKLRHDNPVHAEPWREAVERATLLVEQQERKDAPRRSGKLAASITHRIDARPVPRWGIVTTNATAADGTRYPFVLQAGHRTPKRQGVRVEGTGKRQGRLVQVGKKRWRQMTAQAGRWINLHYAGTGRSTRAWFNKPLDKLQSQVNSILSRAATAIERHWSS